jgi:hypothetical protein
MRKSKATKRDHSVENLLVVPEYTRFVCSQRGSDHQYSIRVASAFKASYSDLVSVEVEAATGSERSPRGTREAILDGFVFWLLFMLAPLAQLTLTVLTMRIFSEEKYFMRLWSGKFTLCWLVLSNAMGLEKEKQSSS